MPSTEYKKVHISGDIRLFCDPNGAVHYRGLRRVTIEAKGLRMSLQIESPRSGVDGNDIALEFAGWYLAENPLGLAGSDCRVFDGGREIGVVSIKDEL